MSTDKTLEGLEMRKSAVILIREVLVALWGRRRKWVRCVMGKGSG